MQAAAAFEEQLIRLGSQASLSSDAQGKLRDAIIKTSNDTLVSSADLLAGVAKAQEKFSDVSIVTDNLEVLAQSTRALGGNFDETVNAIGQFVQNMNVARDEIPEIVGALEQAQRAGAITVADVSATLAQSIGNFASVTGQRGAAGARSFLATNQVLAKSGARREQVRTQTDAILAELRKGDVRKSLNIGRGENIDLAKIVSQLARSNVDQVALGEVFGSQEAVKGFTTLIEQTRAAFARGEGAPLRSIASVDAGQGLASNAATTAALNQSASGRLAAVRINAENNYIENAKNLTKVSATLAGVTTELTSRFPLLTEAVTAATVAFGAGGLVGLLRKVGGGGAAASAGGILGKAGGALGNVGRGAAGLAAANPVAAIGLAGAAGAALAFKATDALTNKAAFTTSSQQGVGRAANGVTADPAEIQRHREAMEARRQQADTQRAIKDGILGLNDALTRGLPPLLDLGATGP